MAYTNPYSKKTVLILDDMPEMRNTLRTQLGSLGFEQIAVSSHVKDALEQFHNNDFDVVLCDYYLAGGTDGQQFLEFLRSRKVIRRGTLFIMVTAEQGYERVVTAAECLPDDYLLKPFTADTLRVRLERLLEKKVRLAKIDALQDRGNWAAVLEQCDDIIAARDRYMIDTMRIKGQALLALGRAEAAVEFYQQMLAIRSMPWASLGLSRALQQQGQTGQCQQVLEDLISESPKLMVAYDVLSKLHKDQGDLDKALEILDKAREISPNSLSRYRAIASVAEEKGDFSRVEQALDQVVKRTKTSPLRETADFARLGSALTAGGKAEQAVTLLEEARTLFRKDADDPMLAAVEAVAQQKAGHSDKASEALARAMQSNPARVPAKVAIAIAKACLTLEQTDQAASILKTVIQSNVEAAGLHAEIASVLRDHGHESLADNLVAESIREIIQLNNEAVKRAKNGELSVAADMLTDAANRLPGNTQIVANASAALLADILANGIQPKKLQQAQAFQKAVLALNPEHHKLAEIAELLNRIRMKYKPGAS